MLLILTVGLASCGGSTENSARENDQVKDHVEVIYFHGKQRCLTCKAIEKYTAEVIDNTFADEVSKGKVVFKMVDISTPEGEALADKYEVSWSSLFVNTWKGGEETRDNLTEFGFGNARKNPDKFRQGLIEKIRQSLK